MTFFPFSSMCGYILSIKSIRKSVQRSVAPSGTIAGQRAEGHLEKSLGISSRLASPLQRSWLLHLEGPPELAMHIWSVHLSSLLMTCQVAKLSLPAVFFILLHPSLISLAGISKRKLVKLSCYACGFRGWHGRQF